MIHCVCFNITRQNTFYCAKMIRRVIAVNIKRSCLPSLSLHKLSFAFSLLTAGQCNELSDIQIKKNSKVLMNCINI